MVAGRSDVHGCPGLCAKNLSCQDDLTIAVTEDGILGHFSVWSSEHHVCSPPVLL